MRDLTYTVRQPGTGLSLYEDPTLGWRWVADKRRGQWPLDQAQKLAKAFSGVVCHKGIPLGIKAPQRPVMPKGRAPGEPKDKKTLIQEAVAKEDWIQALRLASKGQNKVLKQAWEALQRPEFFRSLKKDPETLVQAGITLIKERYA